MLLYNIDSYISLGKDVPAWLCPNSVLFTTRKNCVRICVYSVYYKNIVY